MNVLSVKQLKHYENQWVALFGPSEEVVGSGSDAVEAITSAQKNG